MKGIFGGLSLALLLSGTTALADTTVTPDWVRQNTTLLGYGNCTDDETQEPGTCFLSTDGETNYMVFVQDGVPVFIRRTTPTGYEQVWPEHRPGGQPL